jgi:hypothetical protein
MDGVAPPFGLTIDLAHETDEGEVRDETTFSVCCRLEAALFVAVSAIGAGGLMCASAMLVSIRRWVDLCDAEWRSAMILGALAAVLVGCPVVWSIDVVCCRCAFSFNGRQRFVKTFCGCCRKSRSASFDDEGTFGYSAMGDGGGGDEDAIESPFSSLGAGLPRPAFSGDGVHSPGISLSSSRHGVVGGELREPARSQSAGGIWGDGGVAPTRMCCGEGSGAATRAPRVSCSKRPRSCRCCLAHAWCVARVAMAAATLLTALVCAGALGGWWALLGAPSISAGPRVVAHGLLSAPATLHVTEDGMIHIDAATESDANFMQGYATAEMRLWQLEMQRRIGAGTLAAVAGPGALKMDKMMRTLGVYDAAAAAVDAVKAADPETYEALRAYVAGVNAYMAPLLAAPGTTRLPVEFKLLGFRPAPWTATDSVVWTKVSSFMYRYILRESCSQFDSLPLTSLTIFLTRVDEAHEP